MSEMRYRRLVRDQLEFHEQAHVMPPALFDLCQFLRALLTSALPIPVQLESVLKQGDTLTIRQAMDIGAFHLRIAALAPVMITIYNATSDPNLQREILRRLGSLDYPQAYTLLMDVLQHHTVLSFRVAAAYALHDSKQPEIAALLVTTALDATEDPMLRSEALKSLAPRRSKSLLPLILPLLQDQNALVRCEALNTVGHLGDLTLAPFVEPLLNDPMMVGENVSIDKVAQRILRQWEDKQQRSVR